MDQRKIGRRVGKGCMLYTQSNAKGKLFYIYSRWETVLKLMVAAILHTRGVSSTRRATLSLNVEWVNTVRTLLQWLFFRRHFEKQHCSLISFFFLNLQVNYDQATKTWMPCPPFSSSIVYLKNLLSGLGLLFSFDYGLQLIKGNVAYKVSMSGLTLCSKAMSDILERKSTSTLI